MENNPIKSECPKCQGTGVVKEANGSAHTCWDCLISGRMDVQRKDV